MEKTFSSVYRPSSLSEGVVTELFELYSSYFGGTSIELFKKDLGGKDYVGVIRDGNRVLRGFATVAVIETEWQGKKVRAVFSGDTLVHHDFWGEPTAITDWFEMAGGIKSEQPDVPLYWFLIVKGHRTYRLLHTFCREFLPHRTKPASPELQGLAHHLAEKKFGQYYSRETGLIDFGKSLGHLKPEWADEAAVAAQNPEAAYFLERNPEYHRGVELVCLAELSEKNLRYFALTGFKRGLEQGVIIGKNG
jgi:hypothetical protein